MGWSIEGDDFTSRSCAGDVAPSVGSFDGVHRAKHETVRA